MVDGNHRPESTTGSWKRRTRSPARRSSTSPPAARGLTNVEHRVFDAESMDLLARAVEGLSEDERQATRAAVLENVEAYRNEDGSYTEPAATWGVLAR